jgi:hypothetical protein
MKKMPNANVLAAPVARRLTVQPAEAQGKQGALQLRAPATRFIICFQEVCEQRVKPQNK